MHLATIVWQRGQWAGAKGKYSREHLWHLAGRTMLKASDSPALLPRGFTDRATVNPENMFVAAISSAHMLSWLNVAFAMGMDVASYVDRAHGIMSEIAPGEVWVSEVVLRSRISFACGIRSPDCRRHRIRAGHGLHRGFVSGHSCRKTAGGESPEGGVMGLLERVRADGVHAIEAPVQSSTENQ